MVQNNAVNPWPLVILALVIIAGGVILGFLIKAQLTTPSPLELAQATQVRADGEEKLRVIRQLNDLEIAHVKQSNKDREDWSRIFTPALDIFTAMFTGLMGFGILFILYRLAAALKEYLLARGKALEMEQQWKLTIARRGLLPTEEHAHFQKGPNQEPSHAGGDGHVT